MSKVLASFVGEPSFLPQMTFRSELAMPMALLWRRLYVRCLSDLISMKLTEEQLYIEELAIALKLPIIKLVDGSSGGGSVTTIRTTGWSYLPAVRTFNIVSKQLNGGIPNLGAVLGPAIGLGAARVVACHFSVMAGDIGSLFNAGPKVVEGATFEEGLSFADLGGPEVHCRNGTIDNLARDEEECFAQIRTVLGYLPDCGMFEAPPCLPCSDPMDREDIAL